MTSRPWLNTNVSPPIVPGHDVVAYRPPWMKSFPSPPDQPSLALSPSILVSFCLRRRSQPVGALAGRTVRSSPSPPEEAVKSAAARRPRSEVVALSPEERVIALARRRRTSFPSPMSIHVVADSSRRPGPSPAFVGDCDRCRHRRTWCPALAAGDGVRAGVAEDPVAVVAAEQNGRFCPSQSAGSRRRRRRLR